MPRYYRRRRKFENELSYEIEIIDWGVRVSFNDYLYMNIFDDPPHTERLYLVLHGRLISTMSKKVKKGKECEIRIFPSSVWGELKTEDAEVPIGSITIIKEKYDGKTKECLLCNVGVPFNAYELIRSYLAYKVGGTITVLGSEMSKGQADVYYIRYASKAGEI